MAAHLTLDNAMPSSALERDRPRAQGLPAFGLVRVGLMAVLLAAPLALGAVQPWAWGALAVAAFLLLLGWAIAAVRAAALRIVWSPLYLPAAGFFLIGLFQFAARRTLDPLATREALLKLATDLLIFFLAGQFSVRSAWPPPRRSQQARQVTAEGAKRHFLSESPLRWTLVAYTFLLGLFAVLQFFSSDGLIYWRVKTPGWTFGPYVNHNHFAGLMEMLIPLSVAAVLVGIRDRGLRFPAAEFPPAGARDPAGPGLGAPWHDEGAPRARSRTPGSLAGGMPDIARGGGVTWPRAGEMGFAGRRVSRPPLAMLAALILIPIVSLLLSASRGGFMALLAESLLAAGLIFACGPRRARRLTLGVAAAALVAASLLFLWMAPRQVAERLLRMAAAPHAPEVGLSNRLRVARDALGIWRDHPGLGAGLGSFEAAFPRYMSFPSDLRWDHAHNDYAEALAETGLAGAAVLAAALALFFRLAFGNLRARLAHRVGWMPFAAAIGVCGILVHSFADFNLHMPANAAWFAACAAWAAGPGKSDP